MTTERVQSPAAVASGHDTRVATYGTEEGWTGTIVDSRVGRDGMVAGEAPSRVREGSR